jgi:hypothetical protein
MDKYQLHLCMGYADVLQVFDPKEATILMEAGNEL